MSEGKRTIADILLPVPNWWRAGLPLPHLTAVRTYTGSGKLRSGGRVMTTTKSVGWDWNEYHSRLVISKATGEAQ